MKPSASARAKRKPVLDLKEPALLAAVMAAANDAIVITEAEPFDSPHPKIVYANEGYLRMTGYSLDEVIGQTPRLCQGPGTDRVTLDRIRSKLEAWEPFQEEVLNYRKDGSPFWVEMNVRPVADDTGWYTHWVSVQRDVTERHLASEALAHRMEELEEAHRLAKLARWSWCKETKRFSFSREMIEMFGLKPEQSSWEWREVLHGIALGDRQSVTAAFERIVLLGEQVTFEYETALNARPSQCIWAQGRPDRNIEGEIVGAKGVCQDVTERRSVERRLLWNATHDSATRLLNLDGLRAQAPALFAKAKMHKRSLVVGLVDLDNLKLVNDTLGHVVGDALIIEAARRLEAAIGPHGLVARLGGDEFIFAEICGRTALERCHRFSEIGASLKLPFEYEGRYLDCSASIGLVVADAPSADLDILLQNADLAMYQAKETGRGRHAFFSPEMQHVVEQRVAHLDLARLAVGGKLVVPYFQPQVCLSTGKIMGYEALLRLKIGEKVMPPSSVEHAFESVELATRLGDEMLRHVLEQIQLWNSRGVAFGRIALNVSAAELLRQDYALRVLASAERAGVDPSCLEIEVTEGVLMGRGAERCADALRALRSKGVGIALDDFGTGYASLTHLKSLPITKLKIDRNFVRDVSEEGFDAAIVQALIGLANARRLEVVAEGVETTEQADFLRRYGCTIGQGFLFGAAIPGEEISGNLEWPFRQTVRSNAANA